MGVSIIIAYHNEGMLFIEDCIKQIRDTADTGIEYEIIVVDDCSKVPLYLEHDKVIRHTHNMGVGAAFDTGVKHAQYDNLIILGCDIRFESNGWMGKLLNTTETNPKSIICTSLIMLDGQKPDGLDFSVRRKARMMAGARLLPFHNKQTDPAKTPGFRSILASQWLPFNHKETGVIVVPVVLGALYGIKKSWYQHIDGFAGHKVWGTLEPYISLKSWLFGGNCLCDKNVEVGHIFNRNPNHGIPQAAVYYNKIWTASVLFDTKISGELISYLPKTRYVESGKTWITQKYLDTKRNEYKHKTVISIRQLEQLLNTSFKAPVEQGRPRTAAFVPPIVPKPGRRHRRS